MGRKLAWPILLVAAGCITVFVTIEPQQGRATLMPAMDQPEPALPMGTLEGRHYDLRIESTTGGPVYTVVDEEGVVIAERLPFEELAARFPTLAPGGFYANERGEPLGPLMIVPDNGLN